MRIKDLPITTPGNLELSEQDTAALTSREGISGSLHPLERVRTLGGYVGRLFAQQGHTLDEAQGILRALVEDLDIPSASSSMYTVDLREVLDETVRGGFVDESEVGVNYGGNN